MADLKAEVREYLWEALTLQGADVSGLSGPQDESVSIRDLAKWVRDEVEVTMQALRETQEME